MNIFAIMKGGDFMNEIQKHNQLNADALIQMLNLLQDYPEALKAINPQLNIYLISKY